MVVVEVKNSEVMKIQISLVFNVSIAINMYITECYSKSPVEEKVNHTEKSENELEETVLLVCNNEEGQDNVTPYQAII